MLDSRLLFYSFTLFSFCTDESSLQHLIYKSSIAYPKIFSILPFGIEKAVNSFLNSRLLTGDERIELPPKVLETPIIPFDQSPIYKILRARLLGIIHKIYLNFNIFFDIHSKFHTDHFSYKP